MSTTASHTADTLAKPKFKDQYENYIGGEWTSPTQGQYFDNVSPVDGQSFTRIPRSTKEDVDKAVAAAHKAAPIGTTLRPPSEAICC